MIGGFFLKAADHGDKVYNAMRSRGFTSESKFKLEKIDSPFYILLIVFSAAFLLALTVFERFAELTWLF
jgi:cobalt transport protein, putative